MPRVFFELSEMLRRFWPKVIFDFAAASVLGAIIITVWRYRSSVLHWLRCVRSWVERNVIALRSKIRQEAIQRISGSQVLREAIEEIVKDFLEKNAGKSHE